MKKRSTTQRIVMSEDSQLFSSINKATKGMTPEERVDWIDKTFPSKTSPKKNTPKGKEQE